MRALLVDGASEAALKRLRRRGYRVPSRAESSYVSEIAGPLVDGELHRAERWGAALAALTPAART